MGDTKDENELKDLLQKAGKKVETDASEKKQRAVKGSHLLPLLLEKAAAAGLKSEERSGFQKLTGARKGRAVYVAKNGGRVDISGFELAHPAVTQISEEQAKKEHLGRVRGHLNFDGNEDGLILEAFSAAVAGLNEEEPAKEGA